jgi:dTDP-4-amino-4,6-dideoxygalactose transaminase
MSSNLPPRIVLSPPHMGEQEQQFVAEAFASNWIAPLGPQVNAFEREFAECVRVRHAAALSSGTAALHLALKLAGVGPGDVVLVSTFTFVASVNPIMYLGGVPWFIDSERASWNLDPELLQDVLQACAVSGDMPKALVVVHLYGQCADMDPILEICERYGVVVIEDAAEALGADYRGAAAGTLGQFGIYSFNGNKIITTSGGGMLVSSDGTAIRRARHFATQAREEQPHYQHIEVGYNYRMSNILAAIGRGQLSVLEDRVLARRRNFDSYKEALGDLPGITFMPEAPWGRHTRWLTCITVDEVEFGASREQLRLALDADNIEARPLWKPMHRQPAFAGGRVADRGVADDLFVRGLCLPSGSAMTDGQLERVVSVIRRMHQQMPSFNRAQVGTR